MNFDIKITTPRGVYKSGQGLNQYFGELFNKFENIVGEPEMDKMGEIIREENKGNILKQIQPTGTALRNLKPATWKRKRSGLKLFETGRMFDSIESRRTGKLQRRISVGADYGGYLQYGTSRMKKFSFFGVGKPAMSELQKYLTELLRTKLRNAH